ncbi:YciI family protein [Aestuariibacter halophilus]|uniref:YciI family protein n=1 Tax=Fluctibacter halophilus TaxID=226011 RepID=A0ABS8GFQ5_9ALTE|nr:YciI family protein [Aestuariibacter halophilus]MCC2618016.1 YciI family protein [Aestuariibacter halophilus]
MYIISLTYQVPLEDVDAFIPEHIAFLDKHYAAGNFLLSGRKVPRTGGVILATAASREALDAILEQDPFFREKLARYDITEIVPTKAAETLQYLLA